MYIHCTYITRILISPYNIQQVLTAVNLIRIKYQELQYIKFLCCQINLFSCNKYTSAFTVHTKIAHLNALCLFFLLVVASRAAHDRFDTCLNFQDIERFGDIIIRTIFKTKDLIHILALSCQHHDRHIGKFADLLAYFQPVHLRQHQIQKDNIIFFIFCFLYCLFSIISAVYLHTILLQTKTDSFYDQFLIIYYQNFPAHSVLLILLLSHLLSLQKYLL